MRRYFTAIGLGLVLILWAPAGAGAADPRCLALAEMMGLEASACATMAPDAAPVATPVAAPAAAAPPAAVDPSRLHIHFPQGSVTLVQQYRDQLDNLGAVLALPVMANTCYRLVGHSDSRGSDGANRRLSLARAAVVRDRLLERMPPGAAIRFELVGRGSDEPLPGLASADPHNRRVELWARRCS